MNDFISENKFSITSVIIVVLLYNNRELIYSFFSKFLSVFSIFSWNKKAKTATQDDRKKLYDCLLELQDYLAICGVKRTEMDSMTLEEVGRLTVSATTPLKPSLEVSINKEAINNLPSERA